MNFLKSNSSNHSHAANAVARGLGWFSIGLGLAQLFTPNVLTRSLGMQGHEEGMRAFGLREVTNGLGLLLSEDPTPWVWARVGGDALDMATLASQLIADNPKKLSVGLALGAVAGIAVIDYACAQKLESEKRQQQDVWWDYSDRVGMPKPPEQMRGAARDFEIPQDMRIPEAMRSYATA